MSDTFARTGRFSKGYDPQQVDDFLATAKEAYAGLGASRGTDVDESTVRSASFAMVNHGYQPDLVDAALDRLESAFVQRRRAAQVSESGENAWLEETYSLATTLYPRLRRPMGERFASAEGRGYAKREVDDLLNRVVQYFDGKATLNSWDVRRAVFAKAKGDAAYDEAVVDVFLDRVVTVLLAVE